MKRLRMTSLFILITAFLFSIATSVGATTISTSDRGNFQDDGTHYPWSTNYAAGNDAGNREFRNFFVFDLGSLVGNTITSATLSLWLPSDPSGYDSPESSETYTLYDVLSSDISDLIGDGDMITNTAIFNDLGTGDMYGWTDVAESAEGSYIDIILGSEALLDISNALGGYFAIGGAVTSLGHNGEYLQEVIFVNTQEMSLENTFLTLELTPIPEPATMLLLGTGLAGLAGLRKKFRKVKH